MKFVILHGSYAKGTERPESDLDIAVLGRQFIDFEVRLKMVGEFAEIFGDTAERELDFKTLHHIDPLFRYEVVKAGVLLFGDATEYEEYKAFAYRDYADSQDLRDLELILLKKTTQQLSPQNA